MQHFQRDFGLSSNDNRPTDKAVLIGTMLSFMAYGYTVLTACLCLRELYKQSNSIARWVLLGYVNLLFLFISIYMGLHAAIEVRAFTTYQSYPGGPLSWVNSTKSGVYFIAGNICLFGTIWLSNGFLLYRAVILYNSRQWFLVPPFVLYVGSLVTGGLYIAEHFDHSPLVASQATFAVPSIICSTLCNLAVAFSIAVRLFWYRHLVRRIVGRGQKQHHEPYNSMLAIVVESAGLHVTFSVVYIIAYALHSVVARMVVASLVNARTPHQNPAARARIEQLPVTSSRMLGLELQEHFVAVHGGAGFHHPDNDKRTKHALRLACKKALESLKNNSISPETQSSSGDESMLLVEQAIKTLEDDPHLNAGSGSNLTLDGTVECDAAIHISMPGDSSTQGHFGSVGAVSGMPPFPETRRELVKLRMDIGKLPSRDQEPDFSGSKYFGVFEENRRPRSTLVSTGAINFVQKYSTGAVFVSPEDMITPSASKTWKKWKDRLEAGSTDTGTVDVTDEVGHERIFQDTVGAVAWHPKGGFAAGCWARHQANSLDGMACSISGAGEEIVRANLARSIGENHTPATDPHELLQKVLVEDFWKLAKRRGVHDPAAGILMIVREIEDGEASARVWCGFTTASMAIAIASSRELKPKAYILRRPEAMGSRGEKPHVFITSFKI
ncbi:hypothetical protein NP233_g11646 [Leucocoprinus birnbaumii]|uniref:Uncharacterized protein n=1 Tax=Leucocoprinus birnbaumii TaxID=56174 RepID=A0AAD5VG22_9AGAR|nr:hypothetical protein NP233_g11646 [Leucocoprinus birnbaumii]